MVCCFVQHPINWKLGTEVSKSREICLPPPFKVLSGYCPWPVEFFSFVSYCERTCSLFQLLDLPLRSLKPIVRLEKEAVNSLTLHHRSGVNYKNSQMSYCDIRLTQCFRVKALHCSCLSNLLNRKRSDGW